MQKNFVKKRGQQDDRLFLDWRRKCSIQSRGGKKKEPNEGKGEAEDLGSGLGQSNENSNFGRLKSDCAMDEWESSG